MCVSAFSGSAQLDRGTVRRRLETFGSRWREKIDGWSATERSHSERSNAQTFWGDLLRQFDVIPERIQLFERDATRASTGNTGYIDVFWSGVFLGEAKSVGRDLDAAYDQALDYLSGGSIAQHEWPKFVVVSDFERLRIAKLGDDPWVLESAVESLAEHVDALMFFAGQEAVTPREEEEASVQASKVMADLYTAMVGDDADLPVGDQAPDDPEEEDEAVQRASVFLTRLLFLLYGDDAGLWEADLFYRFVTYDTTADNLGPQLSSLFDVVNRPDGRARRNVPESLARFPYINGGLFEDPLPTEYFTPEMREALLAACRFRWTRISPAVFGSMFQMVKSREARRAAGEHYTTEGNILKTIGPLFIDGLKAEAARLTSNKSTSIRALQAFQDQLATHAFIDPACGSGNFLSVAYAELRDVETSVIADIRKRQGTTDLTFDASLASKVTIDQFHGIENSWWPAKIAETAMFLVDHQANSRLALAVGQAPDRLPIKITAHIHHANALTVDWSDLIPAVQGDTYVFGNPPFLGHDTRTAAQSAELRAAWGRQDIGRLDYVTGWHAKARDFFDGRAGSFAFVTTNSISQGDQVPRLFAPLGDAGWAVAFAHRTFKWTSEAPGRAAVHCVIVGFTRDANRPRQLWDYATPQSEPAPAKVTRGLNAYLVDGPDLLVRTRRQPLNAQLPRADFGSTPRDGGHLIVEPDAYDEVAADPAAAKYLRPFRGARELLHRRQRWCLWLEDLDPTDVDRSAILQARIDAVRTFREESDSPDAQAAAATPHLFWWRKQPTVDYLAIPSTVSETRRFFIADRLPAETVSSNLLFTAPDPDGLLFAVVSSSMFMAWQRTVGGRLKSDLRFSGTLSWNTLPLPPFDAPTSNRLRTAGGAVTEARNARPDLTLAQAYNPRAMDPRLVAAHAALDREVDRAFGAKKRLETERQRLELLFRQYEALTTASA